MPLSSRAKFWLRMAIGYAAAGVVGLGAASLQLPLAWVLGPLLAAAALGLSGFEVVAPTPLRRAGQLTVGATVGLSMTAPVLASLLAWLPLMILTALASIVIAATVSIGFARVARLDAKTAFFALMPGGLAEMGNVGAAIGARMEPIAITQAIRVAAVVCIIPPLLVMGGLHMPEPPLPALPTLPLFLVAALLAAGAGGAFLVSLLRLNNAWMIGALLVSAALTAAGLTEGRMPPAIFAIAQVLLGFNIGSRFRRSILRQLPRVIGAGLVFALALMLAMAGYATLLSVLVEIDFPSAMLASSPGGTAEMAATAQALHLSVALVTAFHVIRSLLVNGFATHYWRVLSWVGYFTALNRLLERFLGRR